MQLDQARHFDNVAPDCSTAFKKHRLAGTSPADERMSGDERLSELNLQKQEALSSMGELLHSYADLQTHYMSQVHMRDYQAFSDAWETSLYASLRNQVRNIFQKSPCSTGNSLLYCAPGPHVPLFADSDSIGVPDQFQKITLVDIDAKALHSAKRKLRASKFPASIDAIALDFSAPFGQRLCDAYLEALHTGNTLADVAQFFVRPWTLTSQIFHDASEVLCQIFEQFASRKEDRDFSFVVSEMVASFTGTAVWLAFRSALYKKFAQRASISDLGMCQSAATTLWRQYNERFIEFHLSFLKGLSGRGSQLLLSFDTCKVYDRPDLRAVPAFGTRFAISKAFDARNLEVVQKTTISWRDHPRGFNVCLHGIPVPDFQAHSHDVELFLLKNNAPL